MTTSSSVEFETQAGSVVPAVTADEMREVDRIAVEEKGLTLVRMMEHAGRSLAEKVLEERGGAGGGESDDGAVTVLAGAGGNGGGGIVCARHLSNRGVPTTVVLDRDPDGLTDVVREQFSLLRRTVTAEVVDGRKTESLPPASVVVDALVGYGLSGEPRGTTADLIEATKDTDAAVVSLDVPSGVDATSGETPGSSVDPDVTLTLALPKKGLTDATYSLFLADLSIPPSVFGEVGVTYEPPFGDGFVVELTAVRR